jgi:hypothetical protein
MSVPSMECNQIYFCGRVAKSKRLRLWKDFVQKDKELGAEPSFNGSVRIRG